MISCKLFLPKFLVFAMSSSVFLVNSPIVRMFAFFRQFEERTESSNSSTGVFVFGLRFKRKRIKLDTPIFLGKHKTSVRLLMKDASEINLGSIWSKYEDEKKKWDRYTNLVNSIRMLTPILTMMIAQVCGLQPGEFIHTTGDTHLYLNHLEQVDEQLSREPRALPKMKLNPEVKSIYDFKYEDFTLEEYDPWPAIKAPVAV